MFMAKLKTQLFILNIVSIVTFIVIVANPMIPSIDDMIVYPNPVDENVHIDFTMPHNGILFVTLFDINGKKVKGLYRGSISK
jgi:hypothetical protein